MCALKVAKEDCSHTTPRSLRFVLKCSCGRVCVVSLCVSIRGYTWAYAFRRKGDENALKDAALSHFSSSLLFSTKEFLFPTLLG